MVMTIKEILIAARNLIQEKGLAKESYEDFNGCFCTHGAIIKVLHPEVKMFDNSNKNITVINYGNKMNDITDEAIMEIMKVIKAPSIEDLYEANDEATKEEVLYWFDKAIEAQS